MYLLTFIMSIIIYYAQHHYGMRIIQLLKYCLTRKHGNKEEIEIRCRTEL